MNRFENLNSYQKYTFVLQNFQVIIASIGIIGNTLAFAVFLRKPLRNHSYSFYYRIMAWVDNLILLHSFRHWIRVVFNVNFELLGPLFCRFSEYQPYFAGEIIIWLRLLVLFDRLVRINYPNYYRIMKRKVFQKSAISIIIIYSSSLHLILPIHTRLEIVELSNSSTKLTCYLPLEIFNLNLQIALCNLGISILIATFLDIKLISYIYSSRKKMQNGHYRPHKSVIKDRKFAISSIGVSFTYFLCIFTFGFAAFIAANFNLNHFQIEAMFTTAVTFTIVANGSVFFVNVFLNSIFYDEFCALFGLKKLRS